MKNLGIMTTFMLLIPAIAGAQSAAMHLPMQGYLTDAEGAALDGPVTIVVSLYDVSEDGTPLFAETQRVTVSQGYFTAYIGDVEALTPELFWTDSTLYIGLQVGADDEMTPRFRLGSVPYASVAQYAGDAMSLGGRTAGDFAAAGHGHAWSEISGIPADIADGDNDTTYAAGTGLALAGTTFSVDTAVVQSRVSGSCPSGQYMRAISSTGTVTCQADNNTTYAAGTGLALAGTTFSVDTAVVQSRVSGSCPSGQYMRAISSTGTVTCEAACTGPCPLSGSVWTNNSTRTKKKNFVDVDAAGILERLAAMPVQAWSYISEGDAIRHIGPTAEDFWDAFQVGYDSTSISTLDANGVALVAIQELHRQNQALQRQNAELDARLRHLEELMSRLALR